MKQWSAKWIGFAQCPAHTAPVFQKIFSLEQLPAQAQIYISGLGAYVLYVNGARVGEDIMQPAFSDYTKTVYYNIYDLKDYLIPGENTLQVVLGNLWYNEQQPSDWQFSTAPWKNFPRMIAEVWLDGRLAVRSDSSWDCAQSQTVFNSLRCGEEFDATREVVFDRKAQVVVPPGGILTEQTIQPIRVCKIYQPVKIHTIARYFGSTSKQLVYDFGINLSGNVQITVRGKRGAKVTLTYFEQLLDNGLALITPLSDGMRNLSDRGRFQTDTYTLRGEGTETWHSEFGYNGFRYVRVFSEADELEMHARCFHTVLNPAGGISCDNPLINKIHSAILQSTLTNFHHMPTDCPHREKNGWTADAYLSAEQAYFNFDMTTAYAKWMHDFADSQQLSGSIPCIVPSSAWGHYAHCGPCWDVALFEIPWQMYRYTGEIRHLRDSYPTMRKYMDFLPTILEDGLCCHGLSDWLAPVNMGDLSPDEAVITLLSGHICQLFHKIARILEQPEDAALAGALADEIRNAYLRKYADLELDTQSMYALELAFDFTDNRKKTLQKLLRAVEKADCHIVGGVFAAKYLLDVLTEAGYFNLAYRIAMQEDYPGWGYLAARNSGTLGEDWGGGKSGNHHFLSEIGAWYYKALAGIRIDDRSPGFRHIFLQPNIPADLNCFQAWHQTPFGKVSVAWDTTQLQIQIPEGVTASFYYGKTNQTLTPGSYCFPR